MSWIRTGLWVLVMMMLVSSVSLAQSLAEVAKKEKKRRETTETSKTVITDRELTRSYGGLPTARSSSSTTDADAEGDEAADQGEEVQEQDETKTQAHWQGRAKTIRDEIARLEKDLNDNDWGEGQGLNTDPRGAANLGRRQKAEQDLAAARQKLEDLRVEARRAGVPPGWVR